jgi:ribosomal protein L11 methyltransferase
MTWIEVSINTTSEAVDWVNTLLAPESISETHLMPYQSQTDGTIAQSKWAFTFRLYLPNTLVGDRQLRQIVQKLYSLQRTRQISEPKAVVVEEKSVLSTTTTAPLYIGQRFVISPSLPCSAAEASEKKTMGRILLRINPTQSFGSGLHPATQLCLQFLEQSIVPGMQTLDLGSGSGILTVAMAKLGAHVLALDNDPLAIAATQNAVWQNQVESQVIVKLGSLGQGSRLGHWMGNSEQIGMETSLAILPEANFDLIVANVLARIHVALAADYYQALRQTPSRLGGLILSGFTTDYQVDLESALYEAGFRAIACKRQEDWMALLAKPG